LTSTATTAFTTPLGLTAPTISASATAGLAPPSDCVLTLDTSATDAISVNNMGSIVATGCGVFANSSATNAIYLNSGTISGSSVGAVGTVGESNSGSNTMSPAGGSSGQAAQSNPLASKTISTPTTCNYTNGNFTAYQSTAYSFTQSANVFCGNTTIGGNSTTDTFAPGIYYVVNGNLTFNNADVTSASGVTFVLTGTSPGAFSWTNYSGTYAMTAPTSGTTAGILVWQTCPSSGNAPANTMAGGSTLQISGAFYAPCGALNMSNNAQITTASGGSVSVITDTLSVVGSAGIAASGSNSGSGSQTVRLIQ
jgi:hypothetical protein